VAQSFTHLGTGVDFLHLNQTEMMCAESERGFEGDFLGVMPGFKNFGAAC